jgi:hypothetical protein
MSVKNNNQRIHRKHRGDAGDGWGEERIMADASIVADTFCAECSIRGFGLSETLGCITIGE